MVRGELVSLNSELITSRVLGSLRYRILSLLCTTRWRCRGRCGGDISASVLLMCVYVSQFLIILYELNALRPLGSS
jgi:hypothetical protein